MYKNFRQSSDVSVMFWPTPQDYNEALQIPSQSFQDKDLLVGQPELNAIGLPRPITGMFASVYKLVCQNKNWAVRCFLKNFPDHEERYSRIETHLRASRLPYLVDFDFQKEGVRVHGRWYPILKMEWCAGEPLNQWIERHLNAPNDLSRLIVRWKQALEDLSHAGIAHGDLQHGNVLVLDGQIKLVDYDGIYIDSLSGFPGNEIGHRNYQHPGRTGKHFGKYLDNFSSWLIYLTLKCLIIDPGIWYRFLGGDECLIFRESDLKNPLSSPVFHVLENHGEQEMRENARLLRYLLSLPIEQIPSLSEDVIVPEDLPPLERISALPEWVFDSESAASAFDSSLPSFKNRKKRTRGRLKGGGTKYGGYFAANHLSRTYGFQQSNGGLSSVSFPIVDQEGNNSLLPEDQGAQLQPELRSPLLDPEDPLKVQLPDIKENMYGPIMALSAYIILALIILVLIVMH